MALTGKPNLTNAAPILNDGFWPDLSMGDLMDQYRIPPEYADQVIRTGLVMAIISVNDRLKPVKFRLTDLAFSTLAEYNASIVELINGEDVLNLHYKNAVFTYAKAKLLHHFNNLNRKENAENAAKESEENEQFWLDESQVSIKAFFDAVLPDSQVLSIPGNHVELI